MSVKTKKIVVVQKQPERAVLEKELRKYLVQLRRMKKASLAESKSDRRAAAAALRRGGNTFMDNAFSAEFGEGRADALHEVILDLERLLKEP